MKKLLVGVLFLAVSGAAVAAAEGKFDRYAGFLPALFEKGIYIGKSVGERQPAKDTQNKLTATYGQDINYDFPACATYAGGVTACHQHTPAFWVDGGQVQDTCDVSTNLTIADGGLLDEVTFDCSVVTPNRAVIRMHASNTDGGTTNVGDAGFTVRVFSHQAQ